MHLVTDLAWYNFFTPNIKVKFALEQATKTQRGSTGISLNSFLNLGTR